MTLHAEDITTTSAGPTSTRRYRTRADERMIAVLARGGTQQDAADATEMSVRTVRRRLSDAEFCRRLDDARTVVFDQAMATATTSADQAVATILEVMTGDARAADKLRAAQLILRTGRDHIQARVIQERVDALERQLRTEIERVAGELDDDG